MSDLDKLFVEWFKQLGIEDKISELEKKSLERYNEIREELKLEAFSDYTVGTMVETAMEEIIKLQKNIPEWIKNGNMMIFDPLNKEIAELRNQIQNNSIVDLNHYEVNKNQLKELKEDYNRCMKDITMSLNNGFKDRQKVKEVLRELFQRMGDNEDLSVVGYDLLEKLEGKDSGGNYEGMITGEQQIAYEEAMGGEKSVIGLERLFTSGDLDARTAIPDSKPAEPKICTECGVVLPKEYQRFKGSFRCHRCEIKKNPDLYSEYVPVKREDLKNPYIEIIDDLNYWITTDREGISTLYILNDLISKYLKRKEEYGIE